MTQATLTQTGVDTGSLNTCQRCGGQLELVEGTDPDVAQDIGGFEETYECIQCNKTGTYTFWYTSANEAFTGVCAKYE